MTKAATHLLLLIALLSLGAVTEPPPTEGLEGNWKYSGYVTQGEVIAISSSDSGSGEERVLEKNEPTTVSAGEIGFRLQQTGDFRWTRFGELEAKPEDGVIRLLMPQWDSTDYHILNYVESQRSSRVVKLKLEEGCYTVFLGEEKVASLVVSP